MNPDMPPCQVCGALASRQWRDGTFCPTHDNFYESKNMTPQTVWIGGRHPCDTPQFASRAPATVLKEKLLEALLETPGASVRQLREVFPEDHVKAINSALSRQEQAGRVFSRRCLETFDDSGARRWIHRWYLTGRNWT